MTFEEFIESTQSLCWSEDERELVEMVWRVAQEAERNRINALVIKVRAEGNFAGTAWWDCAEEIRRLIHAPT
jgi:hypothetical protein